MGEYRLVSEDSRDRRSKVNESPILGTSYLFHCIIICRLYRFHDACFLTICRMTSAVTMYRERGSEYDYPTHFLLRGVLFTF